MSVIMMIIFVVFVLTNMPRTVLGLYEVTTITSILECYDRSCQYHVSSLRSVKVEGNIASKLFNFLFCQMAGGQFGALPTHAKFFDKLHHLLFCRSKLQSNLV